MKFLRTIITAAFILAVAVFFFYSIASAKEEQKQREITRAEKEKERSAAEVAFAKRYGAEFIYSDDSFECGLFTCDLQAKVDNNNCVAFLAFVDDVERNGDGYIVHMTYFLSESALDERKILFHLKVDKELAHKILSAKPVREPISVIRIPHEAPLIVAARIDKLIKPTEVAVAYSLEHSCFEQENRPNRFDSYGEMLDCEVRKLSEDY